MLRLGDRLVNPSNFWLLICNLYKNYEIIRKIMNTEVWRQTLYDAQIDSKVMGSTVLSDLQRRVFDRPVDYLSQISEFPVQIEPETKALASDNKYDDLFRDRQNLISCGAAVNKGVSLVKFLSPTAWGQKMGMAMIAISMFGLIYVGLPVAIAEVSTNFNQVSEKRLANIDGSNSHVIAPSPSPLYPVLQDGSQFAADDLYRYKDFRLVIPKIGLESVVIKNVDPNNPSLYGEQLANGVAHALGSYLPGEDGTMFLFAHSTDAEFNIARYNAKFYAVRKLEVGDEILIRYGDKDIKYIVKDKKVISPLELDQVRDSGYKLVLSTCYPPGTDWQRLVIFADPVVDN